MMNISSSVGILNGFLVIELVVLLGVVMTPLLVVILFAFGFAVGGCGLAGFE
jgi:hypothetical protein